MNRLFAMWSKVRKYFFIIVAVLMLWVLTVLIITLFAPNYSFYRAVSLENYLGTIKIGDNLYVQRYMPGDDGGMGGVTYSSVLTDSLGFTYDIGSHGTDVMLEYIKYKNHLTIRAFTIIDASDAIARESYRVDDAIPWTKRYMRLEDIIEIDIPPRKGNSRSEDTIKVQIPKL